MEDYDGIPTILPIADTPSTPHNACFECGCYKGKPCGGSSRPIESSEVSFAKEEASTTEATPKASANITPFTMHWTYGINVQVPVLNLTNEYGSVLLYASSHCCTVYDYEIGISHFLHGHQNKINSLTCDASGCYAAVADSGEDNIITVWDINKCIPINTIFDPHNNQTTSTISMSPDGKYLASVGNGHTCSFNLWKWSLGEQEPDGSLNLKAHGTPVNIAFNPNVTEHIMIAFHKQIVFVVWNDAKGGFDEPIIPDIRKQKQIGTITGCTYIDKCHNAVASTNEGCILVFGNTLYTQQYDMADPKNEKIFVKTIKVTTAVINCIESVDGLIVTGDADGNIKFYDKTIKLLYWSQSITLPPICSISFDLMPRLYEIKDSTNVNTADETMLTLDGYDDRSTEYEILYKKMIPTDFTTKQQLFICRNFIVDYLDFGLIVSKDDVLKYNNECLWSILEAAANGSIHRINYIHPNLAPLYHEADDIVAGIDVHDEKSILLIAYANGQICMYNYNTHERIIQYTLPATFDEEEELATLTYIKYSPQALHLACSKSNGEIWLLDQTLLTPKYETPLQGSKYKIEKLCFSLDCKNLAYYDVERTVGLYKYSSEAKNWIFYGKTRAHYMQILEMVFSPYVPPRLFTLGQDRNLTEYNLECAPGEFSTINVERIEQIAIPVTLMYYPPTGSKNRYFLMSDNQFKYKKINDTTGMCHSIVLGPAYGCYKNSPVYHMAMIPQQDNRFFVFATEKHIGIQMLPADGNPYKFLGLTGHPTKIKDLRISRCGKFLFTIGENDRTVISWNVHVNAVETFCAYGGTDLEPYYCLIEGSRNGWLFAEMQDLFYYMQILHHGENTITRRQVSDYIPIDELPDLMRACGYYLSEFEAENLTTDITYTDTDTTGESRLDVSFVEFVQMYINHRPAHGVSYKELENAFNLLVMKLGDPDTESIGREEFVSALCTTGESMEQQQLHKCLCALMGEDKQFDSNSSDFAFLPDRINFETFLEEILGIDLKKKVEESEAEAEEASSETGNFMT